jgi:hypothetical protein
MRSLLPLALLLLAAGCDTETATTAVVDNAYPKDPTGSIAVYKVWWASTLFHEGVAAGESSATFRSVPTTATAYALLAPGWDPASGHPPARLVLAESKAPFTALRGRTLHIVVDDDTFRGNCNVAGRLTPDEADLIGHDIFPDDLAGRPYDPETCVLGEGPSDAGVEDAAADAGND